MFSKKRVFEYWSKETDLDDFLLPIVPAKNTFPQWYKKAGKYTQGKKLIINDNGTTNIGMKACKSFFDPFTFGYMYLLHCDVYVERSDDGDFKMSWTSAIPPLTPRSKEIANQIPSMPGYSQFQQAWETQQAFRLNKGYSALITQPFNRFDLPTFITSGIMESDSTLIPGGIPFAIKEGFEGIIPQGTPIAQIVPFKREKWTSKKIDIPYGPMYTMSIRNKITGWYKDNIWIRKEYE